MNPRLAKLPLDPKRKLPSPFMQVMEDGVADFTVIDGDRVLECATKGLCGLCGEPLTYWVAFIGGEISAATRSYSDPPMHVECAEDAFTLCPHLSRPLVPRRPSEHGVHDGWVEEKPARWGLLITRKFTFAPMPLSTGGYGLLFKAAAPKTIRWFSYEDGKIQEETS